MAALNPKVNLGLQKVEREELVNRQSLSSTEEGKLQEGIIGTSPQDYTVFQSRSCRNPKGKSSERINTANQRVE